MQKQSFIFHKHILCITPHPMPLNSQLSERTSKPECTRTSMCANTRAVVPQNAGCMLTLSHKVQETHTHMHTHTHSHCFYYLLETGALTLNSLLKTRFLIEAPAWCTKVQKWMKRGEEGEKRSEPRVNFLLLHPAPKLHLTINLSLGGKMKRQNTKSHSDTSSPDWLFLVM